jgi:subfamily B ATP-binding cassette protein MsbA
LIRRAHRILQLAFLVLAPITAWLIVDHVRQRDDLEAATASRTTARAKELAERLVHAYAEAEARLEAVGSEVGGTALDPLLAAAREAFPDATLELLPAEERGGRLLADPTHGAVLAPEIPLDGDRRLRVRLPVFSRLAPGDGPGVVWLTDTGGTPLARHPAEEAQRASEQDRRKTSTYATRAIAKEREPGSAPYRDFLERSVIGAWASAPGVGGVVAQELVADATAPVRGVRTWHVLVGVMVLLGVPLLIIELALRWRPAKSLLRLYVYAQRYWVLIALVLLSMGLYAAGSGAQLYMIKLLVEDVLLSRAPDEAWNVLIALCIAMVGIVTVMGIGRFGKVYLSEYVTMSVVNDIRCDVGRHLCTLSLGFHQKRRHGELLSRLTNDVGSSKWAMRLIFGDLAQQPLMLAGAIAAGFATNWRLALMIFVAFPVLAIPISRFGRIIKRQAKKRQVQQADVTNVMVQMLSGIRIVKAFRMEDQEARRLRRSTDQLLRRSMKVARASALSETVLEMFNSIGAVTVMLAGGYFVLNELFAITVADLVTFSAILTRMYRPVKGLARTYNRIQDALPGIERIFEIMDVVPEIRDRERARPLAKPDDVIAFESVTFAYDEEPVLKDVSFRVRVGSVVAIVGPTGAGKSTLTDLVARFYDPAEGRIVIDGDDLRDVTIDSLRDRIAVVTQEPFLFHTTIGENIRYGRPDASREEIEAAARAAFVHGEILEQPDGYETVVGDRGSRLSGGQRQRVTIARAILKDADILILDEATSSLDSRSEKEVQRALANLMEGRTTFVVAHRLSTIRDADLILVLERGRIVESGTHGELLERGGLYRSLHAMQDGQTSTA